MYKITITITNPVTNDNEVLAYQVDQNSFDQEEWSGGFPLVREKIDALAERSVEKEPQNWSDAVTALTAKPPSLP